MQVDRCVCADVTFERLLDLARRNDWGIEELRRRTGCTASCGLCGPYIEIVLRTGRTSIPIITNESTSDGRGHDGEVTKGGSAG